MKVHFSLDLREENNLNPDRPVTDRTIIKIKIIKRTPPILFYAIIWHRTNISKTKEAHKREKSLHYFSKYTKINVYLEISYIKNNLIFI